MVRSFLLYSFMFFAIVQSIPGSMQAVADHIIEPILIQTEMLVADVDIDVQCCDENNQKDATPCKSDCSAILQTTVLVPVTGVKSYEQEAYLVVAKTLTMPDLRPPII